MTAEINPHPQRAADAVGGQSALARLLSTESSTITPQAVGHWCRSGQIPAERVLRVEELTGVSRHDLRPDIYPRELHLRVVHHVTPEALAALGKPPPGGE